MITQVKNLTIDQLAVCINTPYTSFIHFELFLPIDNSISLTDYKKRFKQITIPVVSLFNGCRAIETASSWEVDQILGDTITAVVSCHTYSDILLKNISLITTLIEDVGKDSLLMVINERPYLVSI